MNTSYQIIYNYMTYWYLNYAIDQMLRSKVLLANRDKYGTEVRDRQLFKSMGHDCVIFIDIVFTILQVGLYLFTNFIIQNYWVYIYTFLLRFENATDTVNKNTCFSISKQALNFNQTCLISQNFENYCILQIIIITNYIRAYPKSTKIGLQL